MKKVFGWSDFEGEKMVESNCFLIEPIIFQPSHWRENEKGKWFGENDLSTPSSPQSKYSTLKPFFFLCYFKTFFFPWCHVEPSFFFFFF